MAESLDIDAFLERSRYATLFDVRTPAEFAQGHVPGAHNLPLFSNEERAEVGTLYKQQGRAAALLHGLHLVGPKLRRMVEAAREVTTHRDVLVHCWRGGMRSESVAWLLDFMGYRVATLDDGYKAFRRYVRDAFALPRLVCLLGGMTGSGKTDLLHALADRGEQVIDLETLAHHKGSVFGHLGQDEQPSQEHFENELAMQWQALDPHRPVWIEDESRRIGRVCVPNEIWRQMRRADVVVLDVPFGARVERLVADYGRYDAARLVEAIGVIGKRLGGLRMKQAKQAVYAGALHEACRLLLAYYDKAYRYGLEQRDGIQHHPLAIEQDTDPDTLATSLAGSVRTKPRTGESVLTFNTH